MAAGLRPMDTYTLTGSSEFKSILDGKTVAGQGLVVFKINGDSSLSVYVRASSDTAATTTPTEIPSGTTGAELGGEGVYVDDSVHNAIYEIGNSGGAWSIEVQPWVQGSMTIS